MVLMNASVWQKISHIINFLKGFRISPLNSMSSSWFITFTETQLTPPAASDFDLQKSVCKYISV